VLLLRWVLQSRTPCTSANRQHQQPGCCCSNQLESCQLAGHAQALSKLLLLLLPLLYFGAGGALRMASALV
jgi:hypothetical protein